VASSTTTTPTPTAATSWTTATLPGLDALWAAFEKAGVQPAEVALLAQPLVEGAAPLAAHNEQWPLTMASTTKVMTTLAGLQLLPSTFRWSTHAWLDGPLTDGVLQGDLILLGGGDATLNSKTLVGWFTRLHKKGLTQIQGRIVLDQSMYRLTDRDHANTPVPEASNPHHAWPDALVVDDSRFTVQLSRSADGSMQAGFDPPLAQIELVTRFSGAARCTAQAHFEPAGAADPAPPEPAAAVPAVARVVLSGQWHAGCKTPVTLEAAPGRALSQALVAGAWVASGGTLDGPVVHREPAAPAPRTKRPRKAASPYPGKPWDTLRSAPLPELVQAINKTSNNLMARSLLLSIAPGFSPTTSTLQLARQRMGQWFAKAGLVHAAPHIDNGSGLAHNEQASAQQMVQLLQQAWAAPKVQKVFLASLPIAGADGTLGNRFRNSPAQRQAFLKTGTLTGVRSLAGDVRGQSGQMIAVTLIVNSPRASAAVPTMDRLIEWVVANG
jgi:D-alanyl-D-alanine carboxypeptidase/D-alanyl-D-alanine-endopeptidase (penicillin-binding protein 4)